MRILKMKRDVRVALESVDKLTENAKKMMTALNNLQGKVDELTEMQAMKGRGCGLSCTNNSLVL